MPFLIEKANALDRLGLLRPSLIQTKDLTSLRYDDDKSPSGYTRSIERTPDGYIARGVCEFNKRGPHAIILAYDTGDKHTIAFAMSYPVKPPASVLTGVAREGAWTIKFSAEQLPPSTVSVTAWGLDAITGRVYRLGADLQIDNTPFYE